MTWGTDIAKARKCDVPAETTCNKQLKPKQKKTKRMCNRTIYVNSHTCNPKYNIIP